MIRREDKNMEREMKKFFAANTVLPLRMKKVNDEWRLYSVDHGKFYVPDVGTQGEADHGQHPGCWLRNWIDSEECRTRSLSVV